MQEQTIQIDNLKVNYKTFWDPWNQAFLILHWWGWSSDSWVEVWKILWENFFVIVPDLPWFWQTKLDKVYTIEDYAEFTKKFIKKLTLDDIILLWHSNGGAISICLSSKVKLKKLILNNAAWIRKKQKLL